MVPPIAEPLRAMIQYEMELGYSDDQILSGGYHISFRTLQRMRASFRRHGVVFVGSLEVGGRPRVLHDFYQQELLLLLEQRPSAYLDELAYFLFDEYEVEVSEAAIYRTLQTLGWSRKV